MSEESRWQSYLYETHSEPTLRSWCRSLKYFRFCRAYGGHANDGDQLLLAIRLLSEHDLFEIFSALGIPIERTTQREPRSVLFAPPEVARLPPKIPTTDIPWFFQPSHCHVAGRSVHAWVRTGRLELSVADTQSPYDVTAAAIESACVIEGLVGPLTDRLLDPPQDDKNCICPKYYPSFWR
jgi:hypothetical protein